MVMWMFLCPSNCMSAGRLTPRRIISVAKVCLSWWQVIGWGDLMEKPKASEAPSNLAIIGRYVLTPEIFESLQSIEPGSGSEIQLTDGLKHLLRTRPIYAYRLEGTRYDAGDKLVFLKATVEFALKRHDLGGPFREYLKSLQL